MQRAPSLANLRLFLRVVTTGSISEAARTGNLSQPAVSRTIRLLEEDLGVRLFDRTSRKLMLTSAGALLRPMVERLIADFDHAFQTLSKDLGGMRGRVVVGALPSVAATVLPRLVKLYGESNPGVEITLRDEIAGGLYRALRDGQIDLVFATRPDEGGVVFQPLFSDPCVLVFHAGSALDQPGVAAWAQIAGHPFLAMAPSSSVRELTNAALARAGVTAKPLYEVSQLVTMGGLIAAGLGITVLPRSTLAMLGDRGVAWRPLEPPVVERTIGIARSAERSPSPAAATFEAHCLRWWAGEQEAARSSG